MADTFSSVANMTVGLRAEMAELKATLDAQRLKIAPYVPLTILGSVHDNLVNIIARFDGMGQDAADPIPGRHE